MIGLAKKYWMAVLAVVVSAGLFAEYGEGLIDRIIDNHRKAEMCDW